MTFINPNFTLARRSLYPSPAIPLNGIKGLIDPDFIGGRRYLKEGCNFILGKSSKRFSGLSEVTLNTFNDFNVACDYGAPRKPLATYTSTQSTWHHRRSKLDQNKRMIPSPVSKMPARHAIGRTGVRVFDPSAPLSNLIVGTGRIWEWEVRGLEQKIGIVTVTVTGSKKSLIWLAEKPHPPADMESVRALHFVHREPRTKVFVCNPLFLFVLFFFFFPDSCPGSSSLTASRTKASGFVDEKLLPSMLW